MKLKQRRIGCHLLLAGLLAACGSTARPPDTDLFLMVLATARQELGLPRNLALHPLLALWASGTELFAPMTDFNAFDTLSVQAIVKSDPGYVVCTPTVAGSCKPGREEVAVVLSALKDISTSSVAIRLVVTDRRPGQPFQRHIFVRLNDGLSGWSVVEFREISR